MKARRMRNPVTHRARRAGVALLTAGVVAAALGAVQTGERPRQRVIGEVALPPPSKTGEMSLEEALSKRRSIREFRREPLPLMQIGQLLWAGQGITAPEKGYRTAPSAGAKYPIELYAVAPNGLFHYVPRTHRLERLSRNDLRSGLSVVAVNQECVREAALDIVITGVFERTAEKYGERAPRYVFMEAGHVAQNILLQATALGLGAVSVGAFYDEQVQQLLTLPDDHEALYILAVGQPR